jgi:hypothetical protein
MKKMSDEFDVLLPAVDPIEGDLARELLDESGIPSMLHGPDFDMAEFGVAAHAVVRHRALLVPRGARARARQVLADAWGEERVAHIEASAG